MIKIKRAYEKPNAQDGYRILIDRIWPRGVKKKDLQLDEWRKDLAPSPELRKLFNHDPKNWETFKNRFVKELENSAESRLEMKNLAKMAKGRNVTLVYGAKDGKHNHALVVAFIIKNNGAITKALAAKMGKALPV